MKIILNTQKIPAAVIPKIEKMLRETVSSWQIRTASDQSSPYMVVIARNYERENEAKRPYIDLLQAEVSAGIIGNIRKIICQHRFALKMQSAT